MIRYFVHFSNILLLVSYSVRDILWLRCFAIASAVTIVPYFLLSTRIWAPVVWAVVFSTINTVQVVRIIRERRPVVLSDDEQRLYDLTFADSVPPRTFVSLLLVGRWLDAVPGDRMLTAGCEVSSICIAVSGSVEVRRQDITLGVITPGHLIGNALAIMNAPSAVDATFTEPGRYMSWSLNALEVFLDRKPELRHAMQVLFSRDLARKVDALVARDL